MSKPSEPVFDQEFEESVVGQCLRDDAYLKKAIRVADAHHFGTKELSWVWKVISETWNKYRERASAKLIVAAAKDAFKRDEERHPYIALAAKLFKVRPTAPKAAFEHLLKFVRHVNLQLAFERGAELLEKGDLDGAERVSATLGRGPGRERNYTHVRWIEQFAERQATRKYEKEHPDEFTVLPTGIPRLDRALGGGARKGEVGLIMGTTGRGKSVFLSNIIHAGISHNYKAVYFALEMPARQVATRHDARWSEMKYDAFKGFDFKPSELRELEARYAKVAAKYANLFHIISMPVRSADIRTIRGALDDLRDEFGFVPDLIGMDSGDHLKAMDKSLDSFRLQQAEVYWSLKELAESDGYAVWSSVHAGKEWANQIATSEATSESYDKARIADIIISINDPNANDVSKRRKTVDLSSDDDDDEPEEVKEMEATDDGRRPMEMYLAKYRDGTSKLKIDLDCDFSRMIMREVASKGAAA